MKIERSGRAGKSDPILREMIGRPERFICVLGASVSGKLCSYFRKPRPFTGREV